MSEEPVIVEFIQDLFIDYQDYLDYEQQTRDDIRAICKKSYRLARNISTTLKVIHQSEESIIPACQEAREMFKEAKDAYQELQDMVPKAEYFRFYDHWRSITQRFCYLISLVIWLETGALAKHETIAGILGISVVEKKEGFHLDLDDYLLGMLTLCSELTRLAVNSASRGDYQRAVEILKFVSNINVGFRLLNLKNDILRKRYDALKYNVKKIEGIIYDINLRKLLKKEVKGDKGPKETGPKPETTS